MKIKKILTFGGSNSKQSINKNFAYYVATNIPEVEVLRIDLNDFDMPIYSIDIEKSIGIPSLAREFMKLVKSVDGIIVSLAEHNSSYTVAFKNVYDWTSRLEKNIWQDKPLLILSTTPGKMGGKTVLEMAYNKFSRNHNNFIETFSLPEYHQSFDIKKGILAKSLKNKLDTKITRFINAL